MSVERWPVWAMDRALGGTTCRDTGGQACPKRVAGIALGTRCPRERRSDEAEAVNTHETDPRSDYCVGVTSVGRLIQAGPLAGYVVPRLAAVLAELVPTLEAEGALRLEPLVRSQLLAMSADTIDRRLQSFRLRRVSVMAAWPLSCCSRSHSDDAAPASVRARAPRRT